MDSNNIIAVYDLIAPIYFEKREQMALLPEIELLCSVILPNGRILDAGCGNGRDTVLFAKRGFRVIGIDLSDSQLQYAYRRENIGQYTFLKQDILHLDFPLEYFDGIWCCAVFPHFKKEDVLHILQSFYRILVNLGYVIATFKKGIGDTYVEELEFNRVKRYTTFLKEEDIIIIAEKSGFVVKDIYTYNERERFLKTNRNLVFIVAVLQKIIC